MAGSERKKEARARERECGLVQPARVRQCRLVNWQQNLYVELIAVSAFHLNATHPMTRQQRSLLRLLAHW